MATTTSRPSNRFSPYPHPMSSAQAHLKTSTTSTTQSRARVSPHSVPMKLSTSTSTETSPRAPKQPLPRDQVREMQPPTPPRSRRAPSESSSSALDALAADFRWWNEDLPSPPASLMAILDSFRHNGQGDRELLLGILNAKKAEEERLTALIQTRLAILQAKLSLHSAAAAANAHLGEPLTPPIEATSDGEGKSPISDTQPIPSWYSCPPLPQTPRDGVPNGTHSAADHRLPHSRPENVRSALPVIRSPLVSATASTSATRSPTRPAWDYRLPPLRLAERVEKQERSTSTSPSHQHVTMASGERTQDGLRGLANGHDDRVRGDARAAVGSREVGPIRGGDPRSGLEMLLDAGIQRENEGR